MNSPSVPVNAVRQCLVILVIFCCYNSLYAQPANDLCVDAEEIIIIGGTGTGSGSTGSGTSIGAPPSCGPVDNIGGKGVWYTFTGTGMTLYEITTCNDFTDFDTEISVFTGSCGSFTCVAGSQNDGSCGSGSTLSTVQVTPSANTTYYVYVKGNGDACGNLNLDINDLGSACDNDTEDPVFSNCPNDINLFNDEGDCGAIVTWTPPILEDNCPSATASASHDSGDFFPVGSTTVTYSGSDAAGNDAEDCTFKVSITDIQKPMLACPANIFQGTDPGVCGAQVDFTPPIANDNCELDEVKARYRLVNENGVALGGWTSRVLDPSGYFPVGRFQVQWRAKDIYGNKRTCSHFLEVYDDEDPIAVCKDLTVDFNGEEDIHLTASQVWDEAASSDNCGYVEFVSADLTISCEELGNTVAIPVTIKDEAGNEDDCTAYVDVIGLPCGWSEGPNDGSLNCDGQTTSDYDVPDETFTLTSEGCWHDCRDADKATYVYHPLCGDGSLTAKLDNINRNGYAGLMARESLDPWARRAGVLKNYSTRRVRREWRASYGGIVSQAQSSRSRVKWLRIVRDGNQIKSYTSTNGTYWRLLYKVTYPNLDECIYVGMMTYSLNGSALVEAEFESVTLSGSGTVAGDLSDNGISVTPEDLNAWGTVGNVGNGTIDIFPNPASGQAQLILEDFQDEPAQLFVRDAFGKVVRQIDLDSAIGVVMPLDVQDLMPGLYIVSLVQDGQLMSSQKLVVQP